MNSCPVIEPEGRKGEETGRGGDVLFCSVFSLSDLDTVTSPSLPPLQAISDVSQAGKCASLVCCKPDELFRPCLCHTDTVSHT